MTSDFSSKLAAKSYELEKQLRTQPTIDWQRVSISQILQSWELAVIVRLYQRLIKKNRDINSWVTKLRYFWQPKKEFHDWIQDDKLIPILANHVFEKCDDLNQFLRAFQWVNRIDYLGKMWNEWLAKKIEQLLEDKLKEISWLTKPIDKREITKHDRYLDNCTVALYRWYNTLPWWMRNMKLNVWAGRLAEMKSIISGLK
jgi:hypothetical protein